MVLSGNFLAKEMIRKYSGTKGRSGKGHYHGHENHQAQLQEELDENLLESR